jgi:hypothetical protein
MDNQQETKLHYALWAVKVGSSETTRETPYHNMIRYAEDIVRA